MNYSEPAQGYIAGVESGSIPVCRWVKLAVQRAVSDLARQGTPEFPFTFDPEKAERACRLIESLPHVQGPKAGELLRLEPWQRFAIETVFGWVRPNGFRRFRRSLTVVGRGNGKTTLSAPVAIYTTFAEQERGADSICTATTLDQSRLVLDCARAMIKASPNVAEALGLQVLAHRIVQPSTGSRLRGMPSKGSALEGVSLHLAVLDELHAHRERKVYDTLSTGTSKRSQSLLWLISTSGSDASGVLYELEDFAQRILSGEARDDSFFGLIYTTDPDDPWDAETTWRKANPNYGISIESSVIEEEAARATQIPAQRAQFKQKYLCQWTEQGPQQWLDPSQVRTCLEPELGKLDFTKVPCVLGLDLASRLDLTSAVRVHSMVLDGERHFVVFCQNWLPEATVAEAKNAAYRGWIEQGFLTSTRGNVTDLDVVEEFLTEECRRYQVREVSFDPLQSNMLVTHLQKKVRHDLFAEITQFAKGMTQGMRLLQELVAAGRLHTNSPVLLWALNNLQAKEVGMSLLYPTRPKDRALKIDPAVATIMALNNIARAPLGESFYSDWDGTIKFVEDIPLKPREESVKPLSQEVAEVTRLQQVKQEIDARREAKTKRLKREQEEAAAVAREQEERQKQIRIAEQQQHLKSVLALEAEQTAKREAEEKKIRERIARLQAIPPGAWLVIEFPNSRQQRLPRLQGAPLVGDEKAKLIRAED